MNDTNEVKKPEDTRTIILKELEEIRYWTEKLDVTESELRIAIANVGHSTEKIKKFLKL